MLVSCLNISPGLLNTVANRVVAIHVEPADKLLKQLVFSGTVLLCRQDRIYMITVSEIRNYSDIATIKMRIANTNNFITLDRNNFHMDGKNGIVGILVNNPPPEAFQHLDEIDFNEHDIEDQQKVYVYSIAKKLGVQILTPGSIILNEKTKGSFDHNSAGYKFTHLGSPVLNEDGLVGICYAYASSGDKGVGYYSAYKALLIADEIDRSYGRDFTSIAAALQLLRQ